MADELTFTFADDGTVAFVYEDAEHKAQRRADRTVIRKEETDATHQTGDD